MAAADEQLVSPWAQQPALPVDTHQAGVVLRVDHVDARRRHRDVVDVGPRARDPAVVQHLALAPDELVEAPRDGALTDRTLPPGGDMLRLIGKREDESTEDRVGVADALLPTSLATLVLDLCR